jgi:hypothetical protein
LYKCRLAHNELFGLTASRIAKLAEEPAPFDLAAAAEPIPEMEDDWREAAACLERDWAGLCGCARTDGRRLQRDTLEFIRAGAQEGERHTRLFRAAGNLREFGAPPALIDALLSEAALDSGLPPSEVVRQIRCGIEHTDQQRRAAAPGEGGGV